MDLIINRTAALRSSMGVRRLFQGIMQHLAWPHPVHFTVPAPLGPLERINELLQRGRRDAIFWSPTHRGPLNAFHHVVSVHDCINVEYVYRDDWRLPYYRRLFGCVLDRAEAVVALSQATRAAILRNYRIDARKIVVIPAGFDTPVQLAQGVANERHGARQEPFVLMVTNSLPHKNTLAGCRAFAASRAQGGKVTLRVVGSLAAHAVEACRQTDTRVELHQHVDDATLMLWYRTCEFLFSPTLEEGYNLPIAEALAAGANVLCSDIPVHREFFAGQVTFFDPRSRDSMVEELNAALAREWRWHALDRTLHRRSYSDVAADYRALFQRIATGDKDSVQS